jgi:peroxiredoxin
VSYPEFEEHGFQLAVILSTTEAQTVGVAENLGLTYPLYSDRSWKVFHDYGTGHILLAPRQAWVIVDGDGTVRWTWRSGQRGASRAVPMPRQVLAVADELFGPVGD